MKWKRRCELRQSQRTARLRIPRIAILRHSGTGVRLQSSGVMISIKLSDFPDTQIKVL